jgi:MFS family permease
MSTWISTLFEDVGIGNPYAAAFIFALANLPGNIVSLVFIEKYGRRWLLSGGMCLAAVSALGFALDTHAAGVVVLCAALFNAFSVIGWNSLDCLSGK